MKAPIVVVIALLGLLTGCASGPSYSSYAIPEVSADKGRIFFYRTALMGAAIQPDVKVNGNKVGTAKAKGFFYYDAIPGAYSIETSTEVNRKLALTLEKGQIRYVRLGISMGFMVGHVYPELVDPEVGKEEILRCNYILEGK